MMDLPGTVVSFYSYKGGVGRTMAVVNVAMTLATNGFSVLVVDLDLLAPGVQNYFPHFLEAVSPTNYVSPDRRELGQGGMLDMVERQLWSSPELDAKSPFRDPFCPAKGSPDTWRKWMRPVYTDPVSRGHVDVIPAGPADHRALETLAQVGYYRFLTDFGGLMFILSMRDQWWREDYDFTLIDSRTGLSDYLQFCVGILPDLAVVVAGLNEQNLEGLRVALDGIKEVVPSRKSDLQVIPVLSLIPSGELNQVNERFKRADKFLQDAQQQGHASRGNAAVRFLSDEPVKLPYVATLAVAERIVVPFDHDAPIFRSYVRIAEMLARHRFAEIDNLIDEAIYEGAATGLGETPSALVEARKKSKAMHYMYGRIRCESLDAQRLAYGQQPKPSLEFFKRAIELMGERRHVKTRGRWDKADPSTGHWQIELDTLVLYARVLVALGEQHDAVDKRKEGIQAFSEALDFLEHFEKRNHADMFSDRDWDRYSHEVLFTRAFCHLSRLEAQIKEVECGQMVYTAALQDNFNETQSLFKRLMPDGISDRTKKRLEVIADALKESA